MDISTLTNPSVRVLPKLHTTGTTSKPKSVCLSHFNIFWAAKNTSDFVQNDEDDVEAIVMPVCHAFGLRRVHLTLMNGVRLPESSAPSA